MSYIIFKPSMNKEYKLRLTMQGVITLEDTFNKSIYEIVNELASGKAETDVVFQIIKESLRPFYNIQSDNDMYAVVDSLVREENYSIYEFYDLINRIFQHAGFFSNGSEEDDNKNENNTYPDEGNVPESADKCFIYSLRDRAIECGMEESKFWNSTLGEVQRHVEHYNEKRVDDYKNSLTMAHLTADLVCYSVGRLLSKEAEYPDIMDLYPGLFEEELKQREVYREQEAIAQRQADVRENLINVLQHCFVEKEDNEINITKGE